ncbi:hypothetical protein B0H14DRAFT_2576229 [Mycena olivaceomarginata]|nr:hypothetical protein B0H14DRAFT_2576229 [Mycena olivaceomarginata]
MSPNYHPKPSKTARRKALPSRPSHKLHPAPRLFQIFNNHSHLRDNINDIHLSNAAISAVEHALQNGWADSTLTNYGSVVDRFQAFSAAEGVPLKFQLPADEFVLCAFTQILTSCLSQYLSFFALEFNCQLVNVQLLDAQFTEDVFIPVSFILGSRLYIADNWRNDFLDIDTGFEGPQARGGSPGTTDSGLRGLTYRQRSEHLFHPSTIQLAPHRSRQIQSARSGKFDGGRVAATAV